MIVPASSSQSIAAALSVETGEELASVEYDAFPDGELLAAAPGFDADRAVVVGSTASSDAHVELLQLQDAAREWGAAEVVTVLPYMGYARQEDAYGPGGERARGYPNSARAVARAVGSGTDRVITVNPHEEVVGEFFGAPAEVVDAAPLLAEPLPDLDDPLFLSPDAGAVDLATAARDAYGEGGTDYFEKTRLSGDEVEIAPSDADVGGRDVVVVDDIIATGGTMSEAIAVLRDRGVEGVFVSCIHPVLVRDARTKLARAGVEAVYGTDTIERAVTAVSAAPAIADAL